MTINDARRRMGLRHAKHKLKVRNDTPSWWTPAKEADQVIMECVMCKSILAIKHDALKAILCEGDDRLLAIEKENWSKCLGF